MTDSIRILVKEIAGILSDEKPSMYLFGSVTMGDFHLGWSDIDILCLTGEPIPVDKADQLLHLRQALLAAHPGNPYFRSFEGGLLPLDTFLSKGTGQAVYWGTSGERITDSYIFDAFSTLSLKDHGWLLYGEDVRSKIAVPTGEELHQAVGVHYETIRKYGSQTGRSLYSAGWLLDIARCLYTLQTGKLIAKTEAGKWALRQGLAPNPEVMEKAISMRENPLKCKEDPSVMDWLASLGSEIQNFADVLQKQLESM